MIRVQDLMDRFKRMKKVTEVKEILSQESQEFKGIPLGGVIVKNEELEAKIDRFVAPNDGSKYISVITEKNGLKGYAVINLRGQVIEIFEPKYLELESKTHDFIVAKGKDKLTVALIDYRGHTETTFECDQVECTDVVFNTELTGNPTDEVKNIVCLENGNCVGEFIRIKGFNTMWSEVHFSQKIATIVLSDDKQDEKTVKLYNKVKQQNEKFLEKITTKK